MPFEPYRFVADKLFRKAFEGYSNIEVYSPENFLGNPVSALGTIIAMPIYFPAGNYDVREANGNTEFIGYPSYTLPHTAILEISQPKKIIRTDIIGVDGSIAEYINRGDIRINVKGIIVNNDNQADVPYLEIQSFNEFVNLTASLPVECELLNLLGVNNVVVEDSELIQIEGVSHAVAFTLVLVSDNLLEYQLGIMEDE
jgi:purine-nucleoside phosphorylase